MDIKYWYNKAIKDTIKRIKELEETYNGEAKVLRPGSDSRTERPRG
jgi:hypothetical protein